MTEAVDRAYQLLYRSAYKVMQVYWAARRPHTHGALVSIWHEGKILLVRQSYLEYFSLPGGYVKKGEDARAAAVRELAEELGLRVSESDLVPVVDVTHEWRGHLDHVEIFDLELDEPPVVEVDNREVVSAAFYTPEAALELELFPPIRAVLKKHLAQHSPLTRPNG